MRWIVYSNNKLSHKLSHILYIAYITVMIPLYTVFIVHVYPVNRFKYTSWVAIVTPTDRPKSVRDRCEINFSYCFRVVALLFGFFCGCSGLCHRTESDLFLFSFSYEYIRHEYVIALLHNVLPPRCMNFSLHTSRHTIRQPFFLFFKGRIYKII